MSRRCPRCAGEHVDLLAAARCAHCEALRDDITAYAQRLDPSIKAAHVRDLWAHARRLGDDGEQAAHWVRKVIELGWRKTL